jgi:hypothetical protein
MRKETVKCGLDPAQWFNKVESVTAEKIGIETTPYVRNIFKYYSAYKLVTQAQSAVESAKQPVPPVVRASLVPKCFVTPWRLRCGPRKRGASTPPMVAEIMLQEDTRRKGGNATHGTARRILASAANLRPRQRTLAHDLLPDR